MPRGFGPPFATTAMAIAVFACAAGACRRPIAAFVSVSAPVVALTNVKVIDGTGRPALENQTVIIDHDQIAAVGPDAKTEIPSDAQVLKLPGFTVIPGLVGMHDHLFYAVDGGQRYIGLPSDFARLYLATGVTTIRTAGASNLEDDSSIKRDIDGGRAVGPAIFLGSPYIGAHADAASLIRTIDVFADAGVTWLKLYTTARRDDVATAVGHAHRRGLKVTGHLCAVGFRQAAALGIDNLEHGLLVDTEFLPDRTVDQCPDWGATVGELATMNPADARIQDTIRELVTRRVAITSTLAVFETFARPTALEARVGPLLTRPTLSAYQRVVDGLRAARADLGIWEKALALEMEFERRFAASGGLLVAGADPTGWGGAPAGVADQRNVELLFEAGFTPEQSVRIATANGAELLGEAARLGTVTPGKQADLVVLRGDLGTDIRTIRNVEIVFKRGVGYDAAKLLAEERRAIGETNWRAWLAVAIGVAFFVALMVRAPLERRLRRSRRRLPAVDAARARQPPSVR